jgi:phosphatidate phosphatase APP1
VQGRVLEDPGIAPAADNDTIWTNLANMTRRFASDEVPNAQVQVIFQETHTVAITDEEGYFSVTLPVDAARLPARTRHPVTCHLLHPQSSDGQPVSARGEVVIPAPSAHFGVISDVDDTVLRTEATDLVRMARTVFTGNAHSRLAFPGVAALYQALQAGATGKEGNPIFYLSSSPWNLYDLLDDFFALNDLPAGPILLRDWGLSSQEVLPTDHHRHKSGSLGRILTTYPDLPFLLLGDSGQQDPEIYTEVAAAHPGRILAILIRNVGPGPERVAQILALAQAVAEAGTPMHLISDSHEAAQHARAAGWIALDESHFS